MPVAATEVFAQLSTVVRPERTPALFNRAIVLGGSIAGLLAARVLADHAETVLIIDRDELDAVGAARPGVPQGTQVHTLLPGGHRQLERWFPGITRQAESAGAVLLSADDLKNYVDGVRQVAGTDYTLLSASRPLLEALIRRGTLEMSNIKTINGRAVGLEFDGDAVRGVRYVNGDVEASESADFVVDAMGRASKLGDWLHDAGWEPPPLRREPTNINYATAFFRRDPGLRKPDSMLFRRTPEFRSSRTAGAVYSPVEGDRWIVMVAGYGDDRPKRTVEDFLQRCHEDLPPAFAEVVGSELLGEIRTYRQADGRRRDFHLLDRFPAGLVSVGDAVASFNPVYGQGMSSAALHASALSAYLSSSPTPNAPARDFFRLQRVIVDAAWGMSTSVDAAWNETPGKLPLKDRIQRWVTDQVVDAALIDSRIADRFNDAIFMTAHPSTLATPGTVLRSIVVNRRHGGGKRKSTG